MFISFFLPVILAETVKGNILHFFFFGQIIIWKFFEIIFQSVSFNAKLQLNAIFGRGIHRPKTVRYFHRHIFLCYAQETNKINSLCLFECRKNLGYVADFWTHWRFSPILTCLSSRKLHFSQREMFYWSNCVCTRNQY